MKKRLCSLLLAAVMVLGLLPAAALAAEDEAVTVTVTMDTRVVAEDVSNYGLTALPASAEVTVPAGSTVAAVMAQWAEDQSVTVTNPTGSYITQIGDFGEYSSDSFAALCTYAGLDAKPEIFQYAGWTYALNGVSGNGVNTDTCTENGTLAFRYGVYMASGTWQQVDHLFLDAYDALTAAVTAAEAAKEADFSESQWAAVQAALSTVRSLKQEIDDEACGMWFTYFAEKQTALWGTGSPTDRLEQAAAALTRGVNKIVAPTSITLSDQDLELPLNRTHTIQAVVAPEGASQEVVYEAFLGDTCFTVSDAGLITPSAKNTLCWVKVSCKDAPNVFSYFKFKITNAVPTPPDASALLTNIATGFTEKSAEWYVMDMAAYEDTHADALSKTTQAAKQAYIDAAITSITGQNVGETTWAKAILVLQSIGADPQTLYPTGSTASVSAVAGLTALESHSTSAWAAPYTLIALNQGEYGTAELEQSILSGILDAQTEEGCWNEWGDSIQTTSNMLAALAFYYDTDETVKAAADKAVSYLFSVQKDDGTYDAYGSGSDANTAAMVVIGLAAMGIDPDSDPRFIKEGSSALDGLLSFALADNSGFGYQNTDSVNAYATEQAFRALIAAEQVAKTGRAYNVYDFSGNTVSPAYQGGKPSEGGGDGDGGDGGEDTTISVHFTMKTHLSTWIDGRAVTLDENATVSDLLYQLARLDSKLSFIDENGYVSAITYDGETWAERDAGRNSGWKFAINGAAPTVGMKDKTLSDGDEVLWYYVTDYTVDDTPDEDDDTPIQKPQQPELPALSDVQGHWAEEAIEYCRKKGLMEGTGTDAFSPNAVTSRGMIVTILYRLAGSPAVSGVGSFTDVPAQSYCADAVRWAEANQITSGCGNDRFGAEDPVTREQLAVLLHRFSVWMGKTNAASGSLETYADADVVSSWAQDALCWAQSIGLLRGRGDGSLSPAGTASRAETAVLLMRYLEQAL